MILIILVLLNKDFLYVMKKGVTCKTKWENLREDYRTYQTGSSANNTKKKTKYFKQIE